MEETIAAISTAFGQGSIGIVRLSGENAGRILETIFVPVKLRAEGDSQTSQRILDKGRRLRYGHIKNPTDGKVVDEVLAVFMAGPKTYTCEDMVEIYCHGSTVALRNILSLCLRNGARPAEPGEFTKRGFLGGRIDLSQAEAVMDMVGAKTAKSYDVALDQLRGRLFNEISEIRQALLDILTDIAVNIDYPDEDIEELFYGDLKSRLFSVCFKVDKLLATAGTGRIVREGLNVVIVGTPNVGKSSLMNFLLGESRAIVTEIPGTTRDTIEESLSIEGIPIILTDTAGIRRTDDKVEKEGIERSKHSFNKADLVILILDGSRIISEEDLEIMEYVKERRALVLINKKDLGTVVSPLEVRKIIPEASILETSLVEGIGIEAIHQEIINVVYGKELSPDESMLVTNQRHEDLLRRGRKSLEDSLSAVEKGEALDFVDIDVKNAYELFGEIIGETVSNDILDAVFSRFCLGK